MTTTKGLLIAGGVGVGALVLYKLMSSSSAPKPTPSTSITTAAGNVLSGLISGIGGALGSSRSTTGGTGTGSGGFWSTPQANAANYGDPYTVSNSAGSYSAGAFQNYNYADTHPGTALPDGVFGPPVPTTSIASGDDGLMSVPADY